MTKSDPPTLVARLPDPGTHPADEEAPTHVFAEGEGRTVPLPSIRGDLDGEGPTLTRARTVGENRTVPLPSLRTASPAAPDAAAEGEDRTLPRVPVVQAPPAPPPELESVDVHVSMPLPTMAQPRGKPAPAPRRATSKGWRRVIIACLISFVLTIAALLLVWYAYLR